MSKAKIEGRFAPMGRVSNIIKKIKWLDWIKSLAQQYLLGLITGGISLVGGGAIALWAYMRSALPLWGIVMVFGGTVAILLMAINSGYGIFLKRKQSRTLDQIVHIDRDSLANELEDMSQKVAALVGEFHGPMQEAWWQGSMPENRNSPMVPRANIEGKLIERYSLRYAADVWKLVRRTSKVIPIDMGDVWRIQHGVRSDHDLTTIYMFLAALSDDVRNPKAPLPMVDRQRQAIEAAAKAALPSPQSPLGIEGNKQP